MMKKTKEEIEQDFTNIHNYNIDILNREIYLHSYFSDSDSG